MGIVVSKKLPKMHIQNVSSDIQKYLLKNKFKTNLDLSIRISDFGVII